MAHTNSTTNYALPQFIPTDKPAWLTDINGAFSDIDTAVNTAQTKANDAYSNAGAAQSDATTALTNAAAADAKGAGACASIETAFDPTSIYSVGAKVMYNSLLYRCNVAVVTPGPWTGSDNWERVNVDTLITNVDSKIGLLSSLSTSDDSSVVNAINEVNGKAMDSNNILEIGALFVKQTATIVDMNSKILVNNKTREVNGVISFKGADISTDNITAVQMFTIPSEYRPTEGTTFPAFYIKAGKTIPYYASLASGYVINNLTSTGIAGGMIYFNYKY